jgi:hypothetical protein
MSTGRPLPLSGRAPRATSSSSDSATGRGAFRCRSTEAATCPVVTHRQPVSRAGIESVRGTSSASTIRTLLQRQLIALDDHRLFTTTPTLLEYLGLRDLADLPSTLVTAPARIGVNL